MEQTVSSAGKKLKMFLYSLLAGAAAAIGGMLYFFFTAPPVTNAQAVIYFTDAHDPTELSDRMLQISSLKSSLDFMESVSISSKMPVWSLGDNIEVKRVRDSEALEICLKDLENPSDSPLILGSLLNELQKKYESMRVVSYCDMVRTPVFPAVRFCIGAGGMTALLLCLLLFSLTGEKKKKTEKEPLEEKEKEKEKAPPQGKIPPPEEEFPEEEPPRRRDTFDPISARKAKAKKRPSPDKPVNYTALAVKQAISLGELEYTLPGGIKSGGYVTMAKMLMSMLGENHIIAVFAANEAAASGDAPDYAKLCAYLSCALAQEGKRVAVIECDPRSPHVSRLFNAYGAGGVCGIVEGSCTVWDALVSDARQGVDIIAEKDIYPAPERIFGTPAFRQLTEYISAQYDVTLLSAPIGWSTEEWTDIIACAGAFIAVTENGKPPAAACAKGICESNLQKFMCSIRRRTAVPAEPEPSGQTGV